MITHVFRTRRSAMDCAARLVTASKPIVVSVMVPLDNDDTLFLVSDVKKPTFTYQSYVTTHVASKYLVVRVDLI